MMTKFIIETALYQIHFTNRLSSDALNK